MIYLFHGSDGERVRAKAFEWVAKARTKEPNLAYIRLSKDELTPAALEDAIASGGLFVQRVLVVLDDPFATLKKGEDEEADAEEGTGSLVEERLTALADSDNAIVILAPKLAAAKVKKLSGKAKVVYAFDLKAAREMTRGFNTALVNALAARNRAALWVEINRAMAAGDAPEMLHGLLHWKARDLMQKGSRVWSLKESRELSLRLLQLLQESRRGGLDLSLALEKFALTV